MTDAINVLSLVSVTIQTRYVQAYLLATVADSCMTSIATGSAEELRMRTDVRIGSGGLESMPGMMAMLVVDMAGHTEVVVVANNARDELALWEDCTAASVPARDSG